MLPVHFLLAVLWLLAQLYQRVAFLTAEQLPPRQVQTASTLLLFSAVPILVCLCRCWRWLAHSWRPVQSFRPAPLSSDHTSCLVDPPGVSSQARSTRNESQLRSPYQAMR